MKGDTVVLVITGQAELLEVERAVMTVSCGDASEGHSTGDWGSNTDHGRPHITYFSLSAQGTREL